MTLDGVAQSPGRPDEDADGNFTHVLREHHDELHLAGSLYLLPSLLRTYDAIGTPTFGDLTT